MLRPTAVPVQINLNGKICSIVAAEKEFSTGSKGFHHTGKLTDEVTGDRYQVNVMVIRIGSKNE